MPCAARPISRAFVPFAPFPNFCPASPSPSFVRLLLFFLLRFDFLAGGNRRLNEHPIAPHNRRRQSLAREVFTFHLMFFSSLHSVGGLAVVDTPVACGPRHCGQFCSASCASAARAGSAHSNPSDHHQQSTGRGEPSDIFRLRLSRLPMAHRIEFTAARGRIATG